MSWSTGGFQSIRQSVCEIVDLVQIRPSNKRSSRKSTAELSMPADRRESRSEGAKQGTPDSKFSERPPRSDWLQDRVQRRIRYLRISLTDRCNYRCTYCMPEEGLSFGRKDALLSLESIVEMARVFAQGGVQRVRLTGGEPTVRKGLLWLIEHLAAIRCPNGQNLSVAMTTNGESLEQLAGPLKSAGLSSLTVSLDSLRPDRFAQITRRGHLDRVRAGLEAATKAGFRNTKINTVAIQGFNDDELSDLCRFAWDQDFVPRFIELMPMSGGQLFVPGKLMAAQRIRSSIGDDLGSKIVSEQNPVAQGEGVKALGPASYWRVESGAYEGRVLGTIAAMTENFCDACNRLRISSTGQLHTCLARDQAADISAALQAGDFKKFEALVQASLAVKEDRHAFQTDGAGGPQKAMVSIGG